MIIDSHVHLDDVTETGKPVAQRLKLLLQDMKKNKVDHALVLADIPFPHEHPFLTHEQLLTLMRPYPQLHLVGKVPLKEAQNKAYLKKLKEHVEAREIISIKLYPGYEQFYPHDKRYNKVYDLCEEFDIPVMFHSGDVMHTGYLKYTNPLHVDEIATDRPDLKIIICHMGSPWQLDTAAVTFKNENVYAETSGLFYKKLDPVTKKFLHRKIEEFIHWNIKGEKLLFGSDWPITDVGDTIKLINSLHFSKKEKHLIFCGNAKKLFGIK